MLKRNLQSLYDFFYGNNVFLINSPTTVAYNVYMDSIEIWSDEGMLDLVALTYKEQNILLDNNPDGSIIPATRKGKDCFVTLKRNTGPLPKLNGYILPDIGKFDGLICQIYKPEYKKLYDEQILHNAPPPHTKDYDKGILDDTLQRLHDLPYILAKKGIKLSTTDHIAVDFRTGEILFDPSDFITRNRNSILGVADIITYINQRMPKGYDYKFKPYPDMKQTLCLYDVPEIDKSVPENRIKELIKNTEEFDVIMCLISLGKIGEVELIKKYNNARNNEMIDGYDLEAIYLSERLPYARNTLDFKIKDVYTYQRDYMEERYRLAGTRERTETIPPDDMEFQYLFEGMEPRYGTRNELAKRIGNNYYLPIYRSREGFTKQEIKKIPALELTEETIMMLRLYVTINGIEFRSRDLRVFYGTLFYSIVEYQSRSTSIIDMPYLTQSDLESMRDFLNGRIMLETFYYGLSDQAYEYLSGRATLLEFSEIRPVRDDFNNSFRFGLPLREVVRILATYVHFPDKHILARELSIFKDVET